MTEPYDPNQSDWGYVDPGHPGPPYQGPPLTTRPYQAGPYQAGPYQAGPYQAGPYQAGPYQAGQYQAGQYQTSPYAGPPIATQPHQEFGFAAGPYVPPMYSIYPQPGAAGVGRPGQVVAAAVLGYVEAGFLILTGLILFSGSSAVSDWSSSSNTDDLGWGSQFAFAGLGDIVAAGLLIAGGVMFTGGNRRGRTLGSIGLAVCVIEALCWISWLNDSSGAIFPWASFYLILPIIATSMSFGGSVNRWLVHAHG